MCIINLTYIFQLFVMKLCKKATDRLNICRKELDDQNSFWQNFDFSNLARLRGGSRNFLNGFSFIVFSLEVSGVKRSSLTYFITNKPLKWNNEEKNRVLLEFLSTLHLFSNHAYMLENVLLKNYVHSYRISHLW